jgi:hypothetical protein
LLLEPRSICARICCSRGDSLSIGFGGGAGAGAALAVPPSGSAWNTLSSLPVISSPANRRASRARWRPPAHRCRRLQQVAAGADAQRGGQVLLVVADGQYQRPRVGRGFAQPRASSAASCSRWRSWPACRWR